MDKGNVLLHLDLPDVMMSSLILVGTTFGFIEQMNQFIQNVTTTYIIR